MVRASSPPALRSNAPFRRFWTGRLLANTAQNAILLALLVTVVNRTGSTIHSSLLVLSFIVPAAIFGVAGGVAVDHLPRRPLLVLSCLLRAVLCLVFLRSNESVWLIYATNFALSTITQLSGPAESALVPSLVAGEQIAAATATLNVGVILAQVLGSVALAPLFLKTVGPDPLFFLTITLFLAAAVAYSMIHGSAAASGDVRGAAETVRFRGVRSSAGESWQLLRGNRSLFLAGVQQTLVTTTLVVLISVLPAYTRGVLALPAENAVFVFAPAAFGVVLGNWLVPRLARRRGRSTLAGLGFFLFVITLVALGFSVQIAQLAHRQGLLGPLGLLGNGTLYSTAVFSALVSAPLGFGYAIVLVAARLITYEHVPGRMQGRVFAFQGVLTSLVSIVPLLAAGALTSRLGPSTVLVVIAGADIVALLYARSMLPGGGLDRSDGRMAIESDPDRLVALERQASSAPQA